MNLEKIMRDRAAQHDGRRSDKYALSCCKKLCQHLGVELGQDAYESAFSWFHEAYPRFPVFLEARDVQCSVTDMFARMTKTKGWEELMTVVEEAGTPFVGVIVKAKGNGLFVLHTDWRMGSCPGFTKLVRRALTADKGVIFESLESFATSVKAVGWQP